MRLLQGPIAFTIDKSCDASGIELIVVSKPVEPVRGLASRLFQVLHPKSLVIHPWQFQVRADHFSC